MKHWLGKKKYSPGKIKKLQHVATANDFNKKKASMTVSDALLLILKGDVLTKFQCQGDSYKDKDFKMLSVLKKDWGSSSQTQVFKECFLCSKTFRKEKNPRMPMKKISKNSFINLPSPVTPA